MLLEDKHVLALKTFKIILSFFLYYDIVVVDRMEKNVYKTP